jgi:hypothetical protein
LSGFKTARDGGISAVAWRAISHSSWTSHHFPLSDRDRDRDCDLCYRRDYEWMTVAVTTFWSQTMYARIPHHPYGVSKGVISPSSSPCVGQAIASDQDGVASHQSPSKAQRKIARLMVPISRYYDWSVNKARGRARAPAVKAWFVNRFHHDLNKSSKRKNNCSANPRRVARTKYINRCVGAWALFAYAYAHSQ